MVTRCLQKPVDHTVSPRYSLAVSPGVTARRAGTLMGPRCLAMVLQVVLQVVVRRQMQGVAPIFHTKLLDIRYKLRRCVAALHQSFPF